VLLQAALAMFSGAESKSRQGRRERAGLEGPCATENAAWRRFTPAERGKRCLMGHLALLLSRHVPVSMLACKGVLHDHEALALGRFCRRGI
jgi:hypothetical protein